MNYLIYLLVGSVVVSVSLWLFKDYKIKKMKNELEKPISDDLLSKYSDL